MCVLTGPPSNVTDLQIPPNAKTACSFTVQWSKASSDSGCGSVWYIVTAVLISTGEMVSTVNTTLTNCIVSGLNNDTMYNVCVTAGNKAGNSSTAASMMAKTNTASKFIYCTVLLKDNITLAHFLLLSV